VIGQNYSNWNFSKDIGILFLLKNNYNKFKTVENLGKSCWHFIEFSKLVGILINTSKCAGILIIYPFRYT
jgi:hypothetical protein